MLSEPFLIQQRIQELKLEHCGNALKIKCCIQNAKAQTIIISLNKKQRKYPNDKSATRSSTISIVGYKRDGPVFDLAKTLKLKANWQEAGGRPRLKRHAWMSQEGSKR